MKKYHVPTESLAENVADLSNCVTADILCVYLARETDDVIAGASIALRNAKNRIALLERALHQIKNGCVDYDDVANELFRSSPGEIRRVAMDALAGHCP